MVKFNLKILKNVIIIGLILIESQFVFAQTNNKTFTCKGTYYHNKFENRRTSSGEVFSQKRYTAAHRTLPFNTIVKVTNPKTEKSVLVKINDRCLRGGIIDLAKIAADRIGLKGTSNVTVEVLGKEYLDIWSQQSDVLASNTMTDSLKIHYIDSLINDRKIIADYRFYVRLQTVEGEDMVQKIKNTLPTEYVNMVVAEKIYNEKFIYVNIGPFENEKSANMAINKLKKQYPLAHLVRKKD